MTLGRTRYGTTLTYGQECNSDCYRHVAECPPGVCATSAVVYLVQMFLDKLGIVQTIQDIRFVEQKFPGMRCRAIAAQFMEDGVIALFELTLRGEQVKIVEERHYQLVPAEDLDQQAIRSYRDL